MSKKKTKNKRNAELKVIFFIILIAAALFIVSTYAWFSTQRNVSITNLQGTVEVAEGLEISLDAINWANEIVLGSEEGQLDIIKNGWNGHRNISPSEMLPVSTLGTISGSKMTDIKMIRGKVTNSIKLSEIEAMDETLAKDPDKTKHNADLTTYPGYFAFDIFLKNSSKDSKSADILQLNYDSSLQITDPDKSKTGLQNTARIGFARYGSDTYTTVDDEPVWAGTAPVMAEEAEILAKTGAKNNDVYITDIAIWEPNASDHVEYIVNNNNKITWSDADKASYTFDLTGGKKGFKIDTKMPTYALKEAALEVEEIADIYDWSGTNDAILAKQVTLQTTKKSATDYKVFEGVQNLISSNNSKEFKIAPNSVVRLRIYLWLEGQDVDCINYASHGGGITVNIGLVKGSKVGPPEVE